jgi:hypothetical protein
MDVSSLVAEIATYAVEIVALGLAVLTCLCAQKLIKFLGRVL